jgi:hypothetical protein
MLMKKKQQPEPFYLIVYNEILGCILWSLIVGTVLLFGSFAHYTYTQHNNKHHSKHIVKTNINNQTH